MREYIEKVNKKEHLSFEEMKEASRIIFEESTDLNLIQEFLIALSIDIALTSFFIILTYK